MPALKSEDDQVPFKVQPAAVAADFALGVLYSPESSPCVAMRQPAPKAVHCADAVAQNATVVIFAHSNLPPPFNAQPVPEPIVPPVACCVWIYPAGRAVAGNVAVTMFDPAAFVTVVAPATVKKFAVTPLKTYPAAAVKVMVAV